MCIKARDTNSSVLTPVRGSSRKRQELESIPVFKWSQLLVYLGRGRTIYRDFLKNTHSIWIPNSKTQVNKKAHFHCMDGSGQLQFCEHMHLSKNVKQFQTVTLAPAKLMNEKKPKN